MARRDSIHMLVVFCSCIFSGLAYADDVPAARKHFDEAQKHFAVGEFHEAGEEYQQAYKAKPDPALLYDAATAFRQSNEPERAIVLYRNYLLFYPDQPNVGEVRARIAELRQRVNEPKQAKEPTLSATPSIAPSAPEATPTTDSAASTNASAATAVAETPRAKSPVYKKWWLWTIVGVVVAGAAAGVAVALTVPSHAWANAPTIGPGATTSALSAARPLVEVRW